MSSVLVTIPFSHYCEKARWALERAGIAYREVGHLPVFSRLGTLRRGRWASVPTLVTASGTLTDSTDILSWIDRQEDTRFRPYPDGLGLPCRAWEDRFDIELGPHTRRVGYDFVLDRREVILAMIAAADVPAAEKAAVRLGFPAVRAFLKKSLKIHPAGVARSRVHIARLFDEVAAELVDGRRYLVGDRFTAADLSFAALAAPILTPAGYGAALPALADMPPEIQAEIESYRSHPAGAFALRLYADERRPLSTPLTARA